MADLITELPNGRMVCKAHQLTVCGKCCVDFSFMDDLEEDEEEESDGDELLTEEEMKAWRERMIAKKGCACFLPISGSGCKNCDPEMKEKDKEGQAGKPEQSKSTGSNTSSQKPQAK